MISINIELLMKPGGFVEKLWENKSFRKRLLGIIFDEAHCISTWGHFRTQYRDSCRLRYLVNDVPFFATSATLPGPILEDMCSVLGFQKSNTVFFHRSNDRPNVFLGIHRMRHPKSSFEDLDILLPQKWMEGDPPIPKILVFCDSIRATQAACAYLRMKLPVGYQHKFKWFHANMSTQFRAKEVEALKNGDTWGLCVTDSFGMVRNSANLKIIY